MLRRRSSGVAQFSQHMLGKAIDFYIPGVPLERLREVGLRAQRGGVGFYPTSGAPFVHMDTGSVRHWPRMPEAQLASILAKGQLKSTVAQADTQRSSPNLFARLFGGGRDEEEDAKTASAPAKTAAPARKPAAVPEARTEKPNVVAAAAESRAEKVATVPLPQGKPAKPESYQVASAGSKPIARVALASASSETIVPVRYEVASATAKPVRLAQAAMAPAAPADESVTDIINERGYWRGLPSTDTADAPQAVATRAAAAKRGAAAGADPAATASATPWPLTDRVASEPIPNALAYAAQPTPIATARTLPMGLGTSRAAPVAPPETTIAVKRSEDRPSSVMPSATKVASVVRVGDRFNDPWMRAMIVSPSAQNYLRTTLLGATDFRNLGPFMQKPATTVMTSFSNDPHRGMICEKFDGSAVVFVSTATFSTASLR